MAQITLTPLKKNSQTYKLLCFRFNLLLTLLRSNILLLHKERNYLKTIVRNAMEPMATNQNILIKLFRSKSLGQILNAFLASPKTLVDFTTPLGSQKKFKVGFPMITRLAKPMDIKPRLWMEYGQLPLIFIMDLSLRFILF